ncbi:hypothetical protein [Chromobacterium alticapitis]|uniref:hypothetical protein n=1 Tax=Chromobacterium alticapitis TaxID=2073169 RepID=UPI001304CB51|nr:hypothetical protein [Chromobacterium alticapitis]
MLVRGESESEVARWAAEAPFLWAGVASCEIIAWTPALAAEGWPGDEAAAAWPQ